jgi:hypothetical protein
MLFEQVLDLDPLLEIFLTSVITVPYDVFLKEIAICRFCHSRKILVGASTTTGSCVLYFLVAFSLVYLAVGIWFLLENKPENEFLQSCAYTSSTTSTILANCSCYDDGDLVASHNSTHCQAASSIRTTYAPLACFCAAQSSGWLSFYYFGIFNWLLPTWGPLGSVAPLRIVLGMYGIGPTTYSEDRREFQQKYPGLLTIDKFEEGGARGVGIDRDGLALSSEGEGDTRPLAIERRSSSAAAVI